MKKRLLVFACALAAVILIAVAGCGGGTTTTRTSPSVTQPKGSTQSTGPAGTAQANTVTIKDLAFNPGALTIKVGDTVSWMNNDSTAHTVTATGFDSGVLQPGSEFKHTFTAAGTFDYHCSIHPSMTGTIVVQ
ncbi:MAG TPA: cupredoxin family copper-binding protein [Candidatus Anoxymicrobiaceae bacterium]